MVGIGKLRCQGWERRNGIRNGEGKEGKAKWRS
jgi:hypothetical protein